MADLKITRLLVKLNKLTTEEKITWDAKDPPAGIDRGTDDIVPIFFETKYKSQWIAIYHQRYQNYSGEFDRLYWNERVILAFLDTDDRPIWQFEEQTSALLNLFEAVRRQVADVDSLVDDLLQDDDEAEG